jgi:putative phage-type endonuclease
MNETQFIKRPTDRAAWLAARRGFVGGSEVAALFGLSPWRTPVDVYLDKTGRATDEQEPSEALRLGTELEDYAARRYAETTGRTVRNYGYMVTRGHALADVDRLIVPDGEKVAAFHEEVRTDGILECKTSGVPWDDEPPLHYQLQGQLYAELLDCSFVDFAVVFLAPRRDFRVFRMERDRDVGAALLDRIEAFWRESMIPDTPPPAVNLADARALFPNARPDSRIEAPEGIANLVARLREMEAARKDLEDKAELLKGEIAAFMEDADTLVRGGVKLCTFKAPKPRRVTDWKAAFAAVRPELEPSHAERAVAEATAETPSARRFLLCAEKK